MYQPSLEEFCEKAKEGNLVAVYKEILADLETPVSAFLKIDRGAYSYLLESMEGGEKWARYSFLGCEPSLVIKGTGNKVELIQGSRVKRLRIEEDPLSYVKGLMGRYKPVAMAGLPRFYGGAIGYLGYDVVRHFEKLPTNKKPTLGVPEFLFFITDTLIIFDNVAQKIKVVSNAHIKEGMHPRAAYGAATMKIAQLIEKLQGRRRAPAKRRREEPTTPKLSSNTTPEKFKQSVLKIKEYIKAGDVFQAVLSQRFSTPISAHPLSVYRALRVINPSPYMYYLRFGKTHLIGASPEVLVRCEDGLLEAKPIAGTRRRGGNEAEDERLGRELLADAKERAEHSMLVDLGRNDLGRVSRAGTVAVKELMKVERYSHVMHLVSTLQGALAAETDAYDVLRACFPAGTVTGAPKIRAMEILEGLEATRRGLYAGAVGYFSFTGNMDMCINIRAILVKDKTAFIQSGAGIVADSDAQREYEETVNKAKALSAALSMAEKGLE